MFLFGVFSVQICSASQGATAPWIIGSVSPIGSVWATSLQSMLTCVSPKIPEGRLVAGGALGDELEITRKLSQNQIAVASGSAGSWASLIPELGALELPQIFKDEKDVDQKIYQPGFKQRVETLASSRGLHLLMVVENGFRQIVGFKKPISLPEDLSGIPYRVQQNKIYEDFFSALKTKPKMLPVTSVPSAIASGAIEAADQTLLYASSAQWLKTARAVTLTNHTYQVAFIFSSSEWWKSLSSDQRKALDECGSQTEVSALKAIRRETQLVMERLKLQGMPIETPSPKLEETIKAAALLTRDLYKSRSTERELQFLQSLENGIESR